MAITLLRHAPLAKKYQHRYNGWADIHIDPTLFDEKKISILKRIDFDFVYSSDLSRCMQTLDLMELEDYFSDARLREVRFNDEIEGLNFKEIEKLESYKPIYVEKREHWHTYICAEHPGLFERRIKSFLADLPKDKEILICSHSGTLQKMMVFLGYAKHKIDYLEWVRIENVI
jgi:broad specificity phosphatase PhoE